MEVEVLGFVDLEVNRGGVTFSCGSRFAKAEILIRRGYRDCPYRLFRVQRSLSAWW